MLLYDIKGVTLCQKDVTLWYKRYDIIVYCTTRGENELFLARVRCSARVGVEGAAGARDIDEC